jgi:hypothetical protein
MRRDDPASKDFKHPNEARERSMSRGRAIPNVRIISPTTRRGETSGLRHPAAGAQTGNTELSTRPASAADLPWLQSWTTYYGLPAPMLRRIRSFILLKDGQRVGYFAMRDSIIETERGREPMLWIVSAFLIPALRGQGLILKFGEILSRQYYRKGKVGCRVAADNSRMLKLMARGGWKKLHTTRRYTDFMLELDGPFRSSRRS